MALFGSQAAKVAQFDPSQLTGQQKMMLLGATLRDMGSGFRGERGTAIDDEQNLMAQRQLLAAQMTARQGLAGLFGSSAPGAAQPPPNAQPSAPPQVTGPFDGPAPQPPPASAQPTPQGAQTPAIEDVAPMLARAAVMGVDISPFVGLLKAGEPNMQVANGVTFDPRKTAAGTRIGVNLSNVNNRMVDTQDPTNANLTVPQVDKGQVATYDARGNPVGVMNLAGNAQAQGEVAGAVSAAQEKAKAGLDLIDIPQKDGSVIKVPRLQAAQMLGGPGMAAGGGLGVSQTPGDKTYAEDQAKAANAGYQAIQTAGRQAPVKIAQYQELGKLFDGVNGSRLSPAGLEIARWAKSVGMNVDPKLSNKEAGQALGNQIALTLRDPSNGGGMPGSMSNSDRQFLTNMVPNLAQSDQGRRKLVDIYIAKTKRDQDVAGLSRKWQQRYGRIDAPDGQGKTFEDQLQKWSEANPLFGGH